MKYYKLPVRRSLLQRELIGGVPQMALLIIFMFGIVFVYGLQMYYVIIPLVLVYFFMRHLTKKDQWSIDIMLDNVMQKDKLIP
jgi:type IV secretory pathway VirB3-like protein